MKLRKLTKRLATVLTGLLVLCGNCGCTGSDGKYGENIIMDHGEKSGEGTVTLAFFGYKADALNLTVIEETLRGFMDENPDVEIVYEGIKGTPYWNALDKRWDSGSLDDVFMINQVHVMEMSGEGALADLSGTAGVESYSDFMKEQFTQEDGAVYFLPLCVSACGFYCNMDLLAEHGISVPQNLSELEKACDYFVSRGITPIVANNYDSLRTVISAVGMSPVYMYGNSGEMIKLFNSGEKSAAEQLRPGFALAQKMIDRGWIDCEETLDTNMTSDDLDIFAKGNRPFMITGGWASPRLAAKEPGFEFRVYPYPVLDDGAVMVAAPDTCVAVSAGSEYREQAKKLVEYLIQSDVMWDYCDSQSSFSPLREDSRLPSDKRVEPLFQTYSEGRAVIGSDYRLSFPLDSMLREVTLDMLRGKGAGEAEDKLEKSIREYLAEGE